VINKTNLTVTAAANTKNYDGGTTASAVPTITAGSIQTGDTAPTWTETYASKNVGTGLTLTPAGVVTDGNSGMNYNYTYATVATGVINATNLTVTAVANTKIYNGTTTASALPTITAGSIQTGDTAPTWTETYNNKNVGSGKTLTPAGVVTDGNSGANYNYTYATVATGVISQTNMTVTAVANTKIYNGTTSAAALPTITAGSIQTGDTAPTWTETYDTRNQGTGKTLTPAGVVTDGNSGANYNYTYATVAAGVINKTNITVTAASQTKTYDGTTSSTGTPTITSGSIQTGDSAPTWTQTFDSPNASAVNGRTLTPAGVVSDGNGGANYNYTYATATGTINKASATFTVTPYTVTYDGSAHTATVSTITGVNGETGATVGAVTLSTTHTLAGTYSTDFWSFTGTGNYNSIGNTTITDTINTATPTISGVTNSQSISYGTASVTLGGTVSATGPVYPANGETVSVTINGSTQNATISGGAGHFAVSFPTATIPPSPTAYTIAYAYAGDANLNAAANNTGTTLTVTGISVPALFYTNSPGIGLRILLSDITNNVGTKSSLSSPAYAITGVSASSTNGGTVFNNATTILYTPATNNIASDTFTYTLSDGSASATATVTVTFISPAGPTLTPSLDGSNHPVIKFYGILGQSYHIQVSTNLPTWTDVVAVTIPSTGDGSYTWTNTSVTVPPFTGYFRVRYP